MQTEIIKYVFRRPSRNGKRGASVLMFPSMVAGNHYTMAKRFFLTPDAAGFIIPQPGEFIPHGLSSSLKLQTTDKVVEFFKSENFFNNKEDPLLLYFNEFDRYHFIANEQLVTNCQMDKVEANVVCALKDDPEFFYQMLCYNKYKENRQFVNDDW